MQTSTSLMVPDRHLSRVAGFNQALNGGMNILGMASLINFTLNPASALLPILVTKHFGGGVMHRQWW